MTTEQIHTIIAQNNPFRRLTVANKQSIWSQEFFDLPVLNDSAFRTIIETVKAVKNKNHPTGKNVSITLTGEVGIGKTHLIARLRNSLIKNGTALFSYANVSSYGSEEFINSSFLRNLASDFERIGSQGVMQWQEIAACLFNSCRSRTFSPASIVRGFDQSYQTQQSNNRDIINLIVRKLSQQGLRVNPYLLRAIIWTLSETYQFYAVEWLKGNEIDEQNAKAMGLTTNLNQSPTEKEAEAFERIKQILQIAGKCKSIVICFDEFDETKITTFGQTQAHLIASLIKSLMDNIEQPEDNYGMIIVTFMFASIWRQQISTVSASSAVSGGTVDRLSTATKGQPISLEYLNQESTVQLIEFILQKKLYEPQNITPPDSVYPFDRNELVQLGQEKPTIRRILNWCAKNFKVDTTTSAVTTTLEARFKQALEEVDSITKQDYLEDNILISQALYFSFEQLINQPLEGETSTGQTLNQLVVQEVNSNVDVVDASAETEAGNNGGWINFKVKGQENGEEFIIGVAVIQQDSARSAGAGLKRLTAYQRFGLTRGCLVRSKHKKLGTHTQAFQYLQKLVEGCGEWAYLEESEIRPLLDLKTLYDNCETYQLTPEQVSEFGQSLLMENPLLREILSNPSGEIDPDSLTEDSDDSFASTSDEDLEDDAESDSVDEAIAAFLGNSN
ncbi:MAG: P-loop NTPase fold protein [Jaaginema sp. PMC 1079.18]|nr:P-loop NTPase fold protein [Jaaginema sp. PMC 1080.18]MEC4850610.1 P-loop NTPase fold protein [Jaaginema sp. PMC 1079.18]MEC4867714.1 P-loop NTPase fold protein [Jaaginema sp. PMC 1078.18]